MTGAELEQRNIEKMGEEFGRQYTALFREFAALYLYWKEFLELFGTNDKRIERLNQAAPGFFRMLKDQQFETNMLHLARLTDVPATGTKTNLTVCNVPLLVSDETLRQQLVSLVDEMKRKTKFCRDWRNRQFAHRDLALAMQDGTATPLEAASKEKFNDALQAISNVLNAVERYYYQGSCSFDVIAAHNGAATLLFILGFGVKGRDEMQAQITAQIASGKFVELDAPENI